MDADSYSLVARAQRYRESPYGYVPSSGVCLTAIVLFAVSTALHTIQAIYYSIKRCRTARLASGDSAVARAEPNYWFILVTLVPGGLLEVVGWAGRYWSSQNVLNIEPFLMQITTLILAPCFFSAFDYTFLGLCIKHLGEEYSLLKSKWYMILFVIADVVSLVIQAVGGGRAAVQSQNYEDTTTSTNIMVAGIVFQLAAIVVFVALGGDFILRLLSDRPYHRRIAEKPVEVEPEQAADRKRWMVMLAAVFFSALMIVMRGVYRTIELLQGWDGYLITHEVYFNVLDFLPMILALAIFNIVHPGLILRSRRLFA
ncbi:hypothetical protein NliqN6_6499 [Naganishia liquefaciens]|uniref:RTA1 domain-containing protein n=1 Tax=Naganishia liquefaciens TaxID=104408 RepID=A0A8H3TZN7_9TREE|nr:hypothetical protein NliqN6_6499 [Naganishia liquefaciens]